MSCLGHFAGDSPIHRLDPRVRLVSAAALAGAIALSTRPAVTGWALAVAALLAAAARLKIRPLARRILRLNVFMLFLFAVLPLSAGRNAAAMQEGVRLALAITVKGNAIVLVFTALVATIDPQRLACALKRLSLPDKLVHLFALTIRYADVIHEEYSRLRRALRARAFHPRFSSHTLRAFGNLVGLLLVRGVERAERVLSAMKCRGFDGRFHSLEEFSLRSADLVFAAAALAHAAAWIWMDHL